MISPRAAVRCMAGALAVAGAAIACHRGKTERSTPQASAPSAADSARGVVSITGTGFDQRFTLRSRSGSLTLRVGAADSAALTRLDGMEVVVRGVAADPVFHVSSYAVRRVHGSEVVDGTLRLEGERVVLETVGDRMEIGNPPLALRELVGARVWVGGLLDDGPRSYGVIVPPPFIRPRAEELLVPRLAWFGAGDRSVIS